MTHETPPIESLPDGTLQHRHPVTGREVWNVPGRSFRPDRARKGEHSPLPLALSNDSKTREEACDFCAGRRLETPPEKNRWWREDSGQWHSQSDRPPSQVTEGRCDFRRIANLFEIIPYDYWALNLGFHPTRDRQSWRDEYLADETGRRHIETLLRNKLKRAGWDSTRLSDWSPKDIRNLSEAFFFGSHDLLVSSRHYKPGAKMDTDIQSSGDLDPDAHYHYLLAASETARDILAHNPLARYAAIFQNWLSPAGASFEHLHKQILGSPRPGPYPEALEKASHADPSFFNRRFLKPALGQKWLIASNPHAIAVAAFGIAYPALWVFSKSRQSRPWELSAEELKGFSDILHACHAATGSNIPSNEEWAYRPPNSTAPIPFHVTLKWRINIHAGYEGASGIAISPMGPGELQKHLADRMKTLQSEGRLGSVDVAPNGADETLPDLEL